MSTECDVRQWPVVAVHSRTMVTGKDLKKGRQKKRMTLAQAGEAMRVGARTVGRWESKDELPESAIPAVEKFLGLSKEELDPLAEVSDAELVAQISERIVELTRRLPAAERRAAAGAPTIDQALLAAGYHPHSGKRPDIRKHLGPYRPDENDGENGARENG